MAQSKHVLLTHFDLITWARRQGGSGGKNVLLWRRCPDTCIVLQCNISPGKKKIITLLRSYMIKKMLAHS